MSRPKWLIFIPVAIIAGIATYTTRTPVSSVDAGVECFGLYHDILPQDAMITTSVLDGPELRVHYRHASGEDSVICDLVDGELDTTATLNRKIDIMWDNPEIRPRVDP